MSTSGSVWSTIQRRWPCWLAAETGREFGADSDDPSAELCVHDGDRDGAHLQPAGFDGARTASLRQHDVGKQQADEEREEAPVGRAI